MVSLQPPCPFLFWSVSLVNSSHSDGALFKARVSQTIELKLRFCPISGALKTDTCGGERPDGAMYQILIDFIIASVFLNCSVSFHDEMKSDHLLVLTPPRLPTQTFILTQSCWVNQAEEDFYLKQIKWVVLKEAVFKVATWAKVVLLMPIWCR